MGSKLFAILLIVFGLGVLGAMTYGCIHAIDIDHRCDALGGKMVIGACIKRDSLIKVE